MLSTKVLADGEQRSYHYSYDWNGRLTHQVSPTGAIHQYLYDKNGRLRKEVKQEQYEEKVTEGFGTSYDYDNRGNLVKVRNAAGSIVRENQYVYSGRLMSIKDAMGIEINISYLEDGSATINWTDILRAYTIDLYEERNESLCPKEKSPGQDVPILKWLYH